MQELRRKTTGVTPDQPDSTIEIIPRVMFRPEKNIDRGAQRKGPGGWLHLRSFAGYISFIFIHKPIRSRKFGEPCPFVEKVGCSGQMYALAVGPRAEPIMDCII